MDNPWFAQTLKLARLVAGDAAGRHVVTLPDLTGAIDALANLRGAHPTLAVSRDVTRDRCMRDGRCSASLFFASGLLARPGRPRLLGAFVSWRLRALASWRDRVLATSLHRVLA